MTMTIYLDRPDTKAGIGSYVCYKFENIIKVHKSISGTRWLMYHEDGRSICVPIEWTVAHIGVDNNSNGAGYRCDNPDAFEGVWNGTIKED